MRDGNKTGCGDNCSNSTSACNCLGKQDTNIDELLEEIKIRFNKNKGKIKFSSTDSKSKLCFVKDYADKIFMISLDKKEEWNKLHFEKERCWSCEYQDIVNKIDKIDKIPISDIRKVVFENAEVI